MEEMNNETMENVTTEIVEEVTDKLTLGQNIGAYVLAGTFIVGVGAISYFIGKGGKKIYDKIKSKKKVEEISEDDGEVVDVEEEDIHDADEESEDN